MVATRSSTRGTSVELEEVPTTPTTTRRSTRKSNTTGKLWAHTPSNLVLVWLTISLPLVVWDTGYILGRPHTMPGGKWHRPIWTLYQIYCDVDYVYGWKAYNEQNGFSAAQASMNVVETVLYLVYLYLVGVYGQESSVKGRGAPKGNTWTKSWWGRARTMQGREAAIAALVCFSAALMTLSKTVLYGLHEYFSGYQHTKHNDWLTLTQYYILPNGSWIVFSAFMTYLFAVEIIEGLAIASGDDVQDSKVLAIKDE